MLAVSAQIVNAAGMWVTPVLVVVGWVLVGLASAFVMIRRGHGTRISLALGVAAGPFAIALAALGVSREREAPAYASVASGETLSGKVRVLVGIDGSDAADCAAVEAVSLLGASLSTVTLLTILDYETALEASADALDRIVSGSRRPRLNAWQV
jgi:hypothetical protein